MSRNRRPTKSLRGSAALAITMLALVTPRLAHAFCRTTTADFPADYNPALRGCFTEGLPLFWRGACVGYSINSAGSVHVPMAAATRVIDAAFATWNSASCQTGGAIGITTKNFGPVNCSEVRYNRQTGPNQNVIVFRDDGWDSSTPGYTLGLTTLSFDLETGEIFDADIELNAADNNLTTTTSVPTNGFDLLSIVTHEAGHFLGLAHAVDANATMYANYRPGTSDLRTLASDDVAGMCEIYPNSTERRVAASISAGGVVKATSCDFTPRHGFSTECEGAAVAPGPPGGGDCVCVAGPGAADRGKTSSVTLAALGAVAVLHRRRRVRRREM